MLREYSMWLGLHSAMIRVTPAYAAPLSFDLAAGGPSFLQLGTCCTSSGTVMQASGSNGATPGRAVLMQRQGNSVSAGYAAAPVYRLPKASAPLPKVRPSVILSCCVRVRYVNVKSGAGTQILPRRS